jgi:serine phosphatase RsbU (regulator of sigma subunit)
MLDPLELDEFEVDLRPGDRLLVFSDGVPDAIDKDGRQYGYERMKRYLRTNHELPVKFLVDGLASDVAAWRGSAPAFDDLTLLALEVAADNG